MNELTKRKSQSSYQDKSKLYEGITSHKGLSSQNKAIAALGSIGMGGICFAIQAKAPWYSYLTIFVLVLSLSILVVWSKKHVKSKPRKSSGKGPSQS